jgi:hypothetical protein
MVEYDVGLRTKWFFTSLFGWVIDLSDRVALSRSAIAAEPRSEQKGTNTADDSV